MSKKYVFYIFKSLTLLVFIRFNPCFSIIQEGPVINTQNIILASSSLYRQMLLQRLGISFSCESPDVDETAEHDEIPEQLVLRLAVAKATNVGTHHQDAIIIGSDQVSVCGNEILGKPGNHDRAIKQLSTLSGQKVIFYTGLCVVNTRTGTVTKDYAENIVHFRTLTSREIDDYIKKEQPFDCAGGFKSESLGISLISKMEGDDPTALIGLPLIKLSEMLRSEGIPIP